jgi:hypothetical protein
VKNRFRSHTGKATAVLLPADTGKERGGNKMKPHLLKSTALLVVLLISYGFDLQKTLVPRNEILSGGPPKDGIPAILEPKFVRPAEVDFLRDSDAVIGVEIAGKARAYPIRILNYHEVVNDTVGGQSIAVTF